MLVALPSSIAFGVVILTAASPQLASAGAMAGIIGAARQVKLSVPLIVRLEGTNVKEGKALLASSGLPIISADDLGDAARKAVQATRKA